MRGRRYVSVHFFVGADKVCCLLTRALSCSLDHASRPSTVGMSAGRLVLIAPHESYVIEDGYENRIYDIGSGPAGAAPTAPGQLHVNTAVAQDDAVGQACASVHL